MYQRRSLRHLDSLACLSDLQGDVELLLRTHSEGKVRLARRAEPWRRDGDFIAPRQKVGERVKAGRIGGHLSRDARGGISGRYLRIRYHPAGGVCNCAGERGADHLRIARSSKETESPNDGHRENNHSSFRKNSR